MNDEKTSPTEYKYGSIIVRKASVSDFPALVKMLTRAFDDDPNTNWVCLQDRHRTERITRSMNFLLQLAIPFGEVYSTQDQAGAALWTPPGKGALGFKEQLRLLPVVVQALIRVTGVNPMILMSRLSALSLTQKHRPKTPHWYLMLLGTEPSLQGKGIGCALLQPILNRCDQDHLPAYVETATERNVRFYEHRGFNVRERMKLPYGYRWCMLREPR